MIGSPEELERTLEWIATFEADVERYDLEQRPADVPPLIWKAMRDAAASWVEELTEECHVYWDALPGFGGEEPPRH